MDELVLLKPKLKRLKLTGIFDNLEARVAQASKEKWNHLQFLNAVMQEECEKRDHKQLVYRLTRSNLDPQKTLETFDFSFNVKINETTIKMLSEGKFIEQQENIFILGPSGVGKSHLAQAFGHEACRRGFDTYFYTTAKVFQWLHAGRADDSYAKRMKMLVRVPLLILDDFGLKKLSQEQQSDLYDVIAERYEKGSLIITSNRDFSEWPEIFSNPLMASAAIDRLVHKANKIVIDGSSYRKNAFTKRHKQKATDKTK